MQEEAPCLSMMKRFVKRSRNGILCQTIFGLSGQKVLFGRLQLPCCPPPAAPPCCPPCHPPLLPMVLLAREEAIKRTELSNLKREVHLFFCCGITLRLLTIYPLLLSLSLSFTYKSKYCKNVTTVHDKMRFIQTKKYNKNYCYNSKHFQSLTLRPLGSPM